jgi:hypothetical protein
VGKRGTPPGVLRDEPYFPDKVKKIVNLRDTGYKLQEIGEMFGMTSAGVLHIVTRWGDWARKQK